MGRCSPGRVDTEGACGEAFQTKGQLNPRTGVTGQRAGEYAGSVWDIKGMRLERHLGKGVRRFEHESGGFGRTL